jgi:hypothetical protein
MDLRTNSRARSQLTRASRLEESEARHRSIAVCLSAVRELQEQLVKQAP